MEKFRVGLAMAGAVSAGAYSAGVLDFLIEALDAWDDAKRQARSGGGIVPTHDVSLVASSGASAGSMCSALLAVALPYDFPHVRLDAQRRPSADSAKNPFYASWVDQVDIGALLELGDIKADAIPSYLNSRVIDGILKNCLDFTAPRKARDWVDDPFLTRLSVGNLRGVPYGVPTGGTHAEADAMIEHADHMSFAISEAPLQTPIKELLLDHFELRPHADAITNLSREPWTLLGQSALASGAFPLALQPRELWRPAEHYNHRRHGIVPSWSQRNPPDPYRFVCMDGGIFNNEPFDLAHSALLLGRDRALNPRKAVEADAAVVMIDPFVASAETPAAFGPEPIEPLIAKLIGAWTMQSRFSPKDLALAHDPDTFSRYLIAPSKSGNSKPGAHPLACGGLSGFFGFFHHEFRKHDYQLGRRNCQRFLMEHFTIPERNLILAAGYKVLDEAQRQPYRTADGAELQIIPLMPHLGDEEPEPKWPEGLLAFENLRPRIEGRLDAVYAHYRDKLLKSIESWPKRKIAQGYLWSAWTFGLRKEAIDRLFKALKDAQNRQGL